MTANRRDAADQVIYAVSHDLRGPLLNFQGFLRRLRRGVDAVAQQAEQWGLTAEQSAEFGRLREDRIEASMLILEQNARRLEELLQALLSLSRAGGDPVASDATAVSDLVNRIASEWQATLRERNIELQIGVLPPLRTDPARLEQIFRLALDNAVKFLSPERPGRIRVAGVAQGAETTYWVEDNGIGIKAQDLERLFLPFGRIREIEAPGCGIGLATIRKLIRQLGGRVWIESTHQQGTTLSVALPNTDPA